MTNFNEMRKKAIKGAGLIQRGRRFYYRSYACGGINGRLFPVSKALAMELICEGEEVRTEAA
ncbi:MAG: hypothetical protein E6Q97_16795 [Desulfurellales bacterium]|nr:MAG: hypothetical protein E6Q97_16795 [Desulfurellales bacterium]